MVDQNTIDRVADAIESAEISHSMTLIRLVDGVATYRVSVHGEEKEFTDNDQDDATAQAYAHIRAVKQRRQAEAVIAALQSAADTPAQNMKVVGKEQRVMADPCIKKLADAEPFFVLLGRDVDASHALSTWINYRLRREGRSPKTDAAEKTLNAFRDYQDSVAALSTSTEDPLSPFKAKEE